MKITTQFIVLFLLTLIVSLVACDNQPTGEKIEVNDVDELVDNTTDPVPVEATIVNYTINIKSSVINWEGAKITGKHGGTLMLKEGALQVESNAIKGGTFVLDMASIAVTDLQAGQGKEDLEDHLKTGDFFEVETYPTAQFEITEVATADDREDASHYITGNLTIRDVTKQVKLPASVTLTETSITAETPAFLINRQLWGIDYEGKVDDLIQDEIGLTIKIQADKAAM